MSVRNTRLLRGRVQADVGLGSQKNGNWVGVTVELDLISDPALRAAVDALNALIEERALRTVTEAMFDRARRHAETPVLIPERKPA